MGRGQYPTQGRADGAENGPRCRTDILDHPQNRSLMGLVDGPISAIIDYPKLNSEFAFLGELMSYSANL